MVGGDAADRKLISIVKAPKQNVKTYGQVQLTYAWLVAECAKCNATVQQAAVEVRITLPPDWVAPDDRVYRFFSGTLAPTTLSCPQHWVRE